MSPRQAGYSGTPLAKKLGIKEGSRICVVGAPRDYRVLVSPLPEGAIIVSRLDRTTDLVHGFFVKRARLSSWLRATVVKMRRDAAIWVSWPKKGSKVPSEITEHTIREVALPMGLVDVKVCAVDEVWSGLKLVLRKEHR